jgi:diaminopimelate epimerase
MGNGARSIIKYLILTTYEMNTMHLHFSSCMGVFVNYLTNQRFQINIHKYKLKWPLLKLHPCKEGGVALLVVVGRATLKVVLRGCEFWMPG